MERKESISNQIYTVTPRGSIKTSKPSTVEMAIGHRLANRIDELNQDVKEGLEIETGLVRLELVAVYEDGKPEVKEDLELKLEKIGETLDEVTSENVNEEKVSEPFEEFSEREENKDGES